jgi:autotransporter-associated beta strand protein
MNRVLQCVLVAAVAWAWCPNLRAATLWWDGSANVAPGQSDNTNTAPQDWLNGGLWDNGAGSGPTNAWAAGDSAIFGGSAPTQTITAASFTVGNLTFGSGGQGTGTSGTAYTIAGGTLTLSASAITANTDTTLNSVLAGTSSLTKSGAARLTLGGLNTFNGNVNITNGTLAVGSSAKLFLSGNYQGGPVVTVSGGAVLAFSAADPFNYDLAGGLGGLDFGPARIVLNNGRIQYDSATGNTPAAYGANDNSAHSFTTSAGPGTLEVATAGVTWTLGVYRPGSSGSLNDGIVNNAGLVVSGSGNLNIRKYIAGAGSLTKTGNGTLVLGPAPTAGRTGWDNTYAGDTTVNGGTLQMRGDYSAANYTAPIPFGIGKGNVVINAPGILDLNSRSISVNGLSGNGRVTSSAGGAMTLTAGYNDASSAFSGVIEDGSGAVALAKVGAGTLTLNGTNTYTGNTTIGAGLLNGAGTISGAVRVQAGGALGAGTASAIGTIAISKALAFDSGGVCVMRICKTGGVRSNDVVQVTGLLTQAGTLAVTNITGDANALAVGDTFTLFQAAGGYAGGFESLALPALPPGMGWDASSLAASGRLKVMATNLIATPTFTPPPGTYVGPQAVTIGCATLGATIYYTTNGTAPTNTSPVYSGPINLPAGAFLTLQAYAHVAGYPDSAVASAAYTASWPAAVATNLLDAAQLGRVFEGIGAVSGGGGNARLLIDYPEPQRSQILDFLFKPNFGAALQHLKVEIGGSVDSSSGSEPTHQFTRSDTNFNRGYEWWIMEQGRARNPSLILDCLAWGAPGWIGNGNYYSQDMCDYIALYLKGAQSVHGLDFAFTGTHNESTVNTAWIKQLRATLDTNGLQNIQLVAADSGSDPWGIVSSMQSDPALAGAIARVGGHYPGTSSSAAAKICGKPLWASEDWSMTGNWPGAISLAKTLNRNYINGKMTKTEMWCLIDSDYDCMVYPGSGLMRANEPWSGYYEVSPPIWAVAHTTQFAAPGWTYLEGGASALLPAGGSMVTLLSTNGADYSIIVETSDASAAQTIGFRLTNGLSAGPVKVWQTTQATQFVQVDQIVPVSGYFTCTFQPGSIYTLTTTAGQSKGSALPPPPSAPFPMPFQDDFESYAAGKTPRYFSDLDGTFETWTRADGKGQCLRQMLPQVGLEWTGRNWYPVTLIGHTNWTDYVVSADVLIETNGGLAFIMGRVGNATRIASEPPGYWLGLNSAAGQWELHTASSLLASGPANLLTNTWHNLSLAMAGTTLSCYVDGVLKTNVNDSTYAAGVAGLGCGWHYAQFDNFAALPQTLVAENAAYSRTAGQAWQIRVSDLLTNVTAVATTNFGLANLGTSTNGVAVTSDGTWVYYSGSNAVNDRFAYTVTNAYGVLATGQVGLVVVPPPFPDPPAGSLSVSNGTVNLSFNLVPAYRYVLERTTNLAPPAWVAIATNVAPSNGVLNVLDSFPDLGGKNSDPPAAYYRLHYVAP